MWLSCTILPFRRAAQATHLPARFTSHAAHGVALTKLASCAPHLSAGVQAIHVCGTAEVVQMLHEWTRSNIDAADARKRTPLMHASGLQQQPEVLAELLACGADVNATDADGCNALHVACMEVCHFECTPLWARSLCERPFGVHNVVCLCGAWLLRSNWSAALDMCEAHTVSSKPGVKDMLGFEYRMPIHIAEDATNHYRQPCASMQPHSPSSTSRARSLTAFLLMQGSASMVPLLVKAGCLTAAVDNAGYTPVERALVGQDVAASYALYCAGALFTKRQLLFLGILLRETSLIGCAPALCLHAMANRRCAVLRLRPSLYVQIQHVLRYGARIISCMSAQATRHGVAALVAVHAMSAGNFLSALPSHCMAARRAAPAVPRLRQSHHLPSRPASCRCIPSTSHPCAARCSSCATRCRALLAVACQRSCSQAFRASCGTAWRTAHGSRQPQGRCSCARARASWMAA